VVASMGATRASRLRSESCPRILQPAAQPVSPVESGCHPAKVNTIDERDFSAISVTPSEPGTNLIVRVPGARRVGATPKVGKLANVSFARSAGAL
jgi:hypothetical protein